MDYYGEEALPPGNDSSQGNCDRNVSLQFLQPPVSGRIASRKFLQPGAVGRISLSNFHRRPVNGKKSSRKFLQPRVVGQISLSNFHRRPVNGKNSSRKFGQPPVGGRIASRKHLQTREGNGNSSENAFPIILCGQTPTRNKFPRLPLMHTYDKKHHTQTDGGLGLPVADGRHVPPGAASTPTESAVCRL